jgi:hypothetical protein
MADGISPISVDFSNLKDIPDPVSSYANAFQVGRQMAGQQIASNAFKAYASNPTGQIDPNLAAASPQDYLALQTRQQQAGDRAANVAGATALANGDTAGAAKALAPTGNVEAVNQLNTQQQTQIAGLTDKAAGLARGLLGDPDPADRISKLQHFAATSPQVATIFRSAGVDPANLTTDDVSDRSIAIVLHSLLGAKGSEALDKPTVVGKDSSLLFNPGSLGAAGAGAASTASGGGAAPSGALPGGSTLSPEDRDALIRMGVSEAGGEPTTGQAAVLHVALNRLNSGYGGAKSLSQVVNAPGQFEGMTSNRANLSSSDPQYQRMGQLVDQVTSGQVPDPTGGAVNFYNPVLNARLAAHNGDRSAVASFDDGKGQRIGNHVFFGGNPDAAGDGSYQVASNGATPPPPSGSQSLPGGYTLVRPGGAADSADAHGHVSTSAELKAAGLPATTQAWTNAKGEVGALPKEIAAQTQVGGAGGGDSSLTGDAYLATLPPFEANKLRAIAAGRVAMPTSRAFDSEKTLDQLEQYDPSFDQGKYKARYAVNADFASAKNGSTGGTIASGSTVINHLTNLDSNIPQLQNSGWRSGNKLGNFLATETGNPALESFRTDVEAIASEATKYFRGSGGAEADVQAWKQRFLDSASPAQLHATVTEFAHVIGGRLGPLADKYNSAMGTNRPPEDFLEPAAAAQFQRYRGDSNAQIAEQAFRHQFAISHPGADPDTAWQAEQAKRSFSTAPQTNGGARPTATSAPTPGGSGTRVAPTGAGHLTDAQLRAQLGL